MFAFVFIVRKLWIKTVQASVCVGRMVDVGPVGVHGVVVEMCQEGEGVRYICVISLHRN